ncbi:MAG: hypothetical protein WBM50_21565 [Acidimicrobiales bacterium]
MTRPWVHYLRSHGIVPSLVAVGGIVVVDVVAGGLVFNAGQQEPVSVQLSAIVPALAAAALLVLSGSRAPLVDALAARRLQAHRLGLDIGLAGLTLIALWLFAPDASTTGPSTAAGLRNLVGFVGIGWLASALTGNELAWIPGTFLAMVATSVGLRPTAITPAWSWILADDGDLGALTIAVGLAILGLAIRFSAVRLPGRRWLPTPS